jgi:hypothetical protein
MNRLHRISTAIAVAAVLATGGAVFAQTANPGNTPAGASTSSGAGVVTSGTAAPAGQTPRATDSSVGTQGGGTGAGMGDTPAGKSGATAKHDSTHVKSASTKKTSTKSGSSKSASSKSKSKSKTKTKTPA